MASALREFFRIPRRHRVVTGIDLGAHSVKVVSFERTKSGRPKLVHAAKEPVAPAGPEDSRTRQAEALKKAVGRRRGRLGWVVAAFPRELTSARIITLPTIQPAEVADMVRFDAERHVPFSLDEGEVGHQILAQHENYTSDVLLVGARKDHLEQFLGVFRAAGVDPDYVSVDVVGSIRPFASEESDGRTVAVLDIGQRNTDLAIFRNGKIRFSRTLTTGTGRLEQYLEEEGKGREVTGDASLWDFGRNGDVEGTAEQRWLEELLPELKRTLQAFRHESQGGEVNRIIVCGGLAHARGVEGKLRERLGVETKAARDVLPPQVQGGKPGALGPEMAAAVGVGLEVFEREQTLNLLPQGIVAARNREHTRGFIRQVATLVVMIALLTGGVIYNRFSLEQKKIALRENDIAELQPRISSALKMKEELRILDSLRDREVTAYRLLQELYEITPEALQIEDLHFAKALDKEEADALDLGAKTMNTQAVLQYAEILRKSGYVDSLELGREYEAVEYGVRLRRFEVKAYLVDSLSAAEAASAPPGKERRRP